MVLEGTITMFGAVKSFTFVKGGQRVSLFTILKAFCRFRGPITKWDQKVHFSDNDVNTIGTPL